MKYKTLFRLAIKAIGVYMLVEGVTSGLSYLGWVVVTLQRIGSGMPTGAWFEFVGVCGPFAQIAIGLYLFFGGKWIVDRAIPGNRPYCQECGYDLSGAVRNRCPECDTPFRPADVRPPMAFPPDKDAPNG